MMIVTHCTCKNCGHALTCTLISEDYDTFVSYEAVVVYGAKAGQVSGVSRCPKCGTELNADTVKVIPTGPGAAAEG